MHSVYDDALNVVLPSGIVSVVSHSKGRGPINLALAANQPLRGVSGLVNRGSEVSYEGGLLKIGRRLHIAFDGAELYRSPLKFRRACSSHDRVRKNVAEAEAQILEAGRPEGLGSLLRILETGIRPSDTGSPFVAAALPAVISLTGELSRGNVMGSVGAARGLLGLGVGLTPSGDDLLTGAFLAMVLGSKNGIGGPPHLPEVAEKVAHEAEKRTTLLSQSYIELASRGKGNEAVVRFVEELFTGRGDPLWESLTGLLDFGASSGADIATGVVIGARVALGDGVGAC